MVSFILGSQNSPFPHSLPSPESIMFPPSPYNLYQQVPPQPPEAPSYQYQYPISPLSQARYHAVCLDTRGAGPRPITLWIH